MTNEVIQKCQQTSLVPDDIERLMAFSKNCVDYSKYYALSGTPLGSTASEAVVKKLNKFAEGVETKGAECMPTRKVK